MERRNIEDYEEKENYIIQITIKDRKNHLNSTIFKELSEQKYIGDTTLYVGCNNGSSMAILKPFTKLLIGYDINHEAVKEAKKILKGIPRCDVLCGDIRKTIFKDNSFNTIMAMQVFEHIYEDDIDIVMKEICRILKDDGNFILEVPAEDAPYYKDSCHVTFFTEESFKRSVEKYFDILNFTYETRENPGMPGKHYDWRIICQKK